MTTTDPLAGFKAMIDRIQALEAKVADLESRAPEVRGYVTLEKFSDQSGVPVNTLRNWYSRRENALPTVKPGKLRMIDPVQAREWMEREGKAYPV